MILVLSTKFCESQGSFLTLTICKTLAQQGHSMYVTTISTGEELENDFRNAHNIYSKTKRGSVLLLKPEIDKAEDPNPEWITTIQHKKYFAYLQELDDVYLIVGLLPETAQTAVELQKTLSCRLILVSSRKGDIDSERMQLMEKADEFWCVGPDVYSHYKQIFENGCPSLCDKQNEILLEPYTKLIAGKEKMSSIQNNGSSTHIFASVWDISNCKDQIEGKKNDTHSFQCFGAALRKINSEKESNNVVYWQVYGMTDDEVIALNAESPMKKLDLKTTSEVPTNQEFPWNSYSAILFPQVRNEGFNFQAMNAVWLGIPTLMSCDSNVGKLLSTLPCPEKSKAIVNLTGNAETDAENWKRKILDEIIGENARPIEWTKKLSECLQRTVTMRANYFHLLYTIPEYHSADEEENHVEYLLEVKDKISQF